jgi:DNA-binding transcriptional regulator LsrR (DeoR family)
LQKGIASLASQISHENASKATLHMVAKMHYESNIAQVEIARRLGVSTATISRMLTSARSLGIIRIEVLDPSQPHDMSEKLKRAIGLKRAAVVDTPSTGVLSALAAPLDALISDLRLKSGSVLGIGWGRAVREVIATGLPRIPGVDVVALNGGLQQAAPHFQTNEFVRKAAEKMGGVPHFLHAPYLSSVELKDAFLSDPLMSETTGLWDKLDCAIVGIGLPHAQNTPDASAATISEQELPGVAGDVIRHYVDIHGHLLMWEGESRLIAASADQLRKAGLSIGVAAGVEKAASILSAVRSGMVSALVTDTSTAQAVLNLLK